MVSTSQISMLPSHSSVWADRVSFNMYGDCCFLIFFLFFPSKLPTTLSSLGTSLGTFWEHGKATPSNSTLKPILVQSESGDGGKEMFPWFHPRGHAMLPAPKPSLLVLFLSALYFRSAGIIIVRMICLDAVVIGQWWAPDLVCTHEWKGVLIKRAWE